jgi:nitrite reductase/ring-hydroxylating ferredoxin subunit
VGLAEPSRLICDSAALSEGGRGFRFSVSRGDRTLPAFAIRYGGLVYAYLNQCAHVPVELDWVEGEFFEGTGLYLVCATHGATYEPDTGHCVMGPCKGRRLTALEVTERDGGIFLMDGDQDHG